MLDFTHALCACGCGVSFEQLDSRGRSRRFAVGHSRRKVRRKVKTPEENRANALQWYNKNRERLAVSRATNREAIRARCRSYYHADIEAARLDGVMRANRRRANILGCDGSCSAEQWMQRVEYYGWRCRYCRVGLTRATLTQDHAIPISRDGTNWPSNLVPACKSCNSGKHDKTLFEFIGVSRG